MSSEFEAARAALTVPARSVTFSPAGAMRALSETAPWSIAGIPETYQGLPMEIVSGQSEPCIVSSEPLEPGLSWWGVTSMTGQRCALRARDGDDAMDLCNCWFNAVASTAVPLADIAACVEFMR